MERGEQLRVIKGLMSHLDNGTNENSHLQLVEQANQESNDSNHEIRFYKIRKY